MRVKLGPYKNYLGPYQLAEKLCFWVKDVEDEYGFKRKPDWVHNFGEWLAHGSVEPDPKPGDEPRSWDRERHVTLLNKFLTWVDSKKQRTVKVKIDKWDTWSMDHTLAYIILPMLKQLQETKHGAPYVDDSDVPEELKSTSAPPRENEWDIDDNHFKRWDYVLDEMIFAFEHIVDDDWESEYHTGKIDFVSRVTDWDESGKPKMYALEKGPNDTHECDYDAIKAINDRINRGLVLFGKYYRNLWD